MDSNSECNLSTDDNSSSSCVSNFGNNDKQEKKSHLNGYERSDNLQKIYRCEHKKCAAYFYRQSHLQDHLNRHIGIRPFQCNENNCSKAYFAWKNLRKHLINFHKMENVKKSLYVNKEDKSHKCSYEGCKAEFSRPWKLVSHMSQHTGTKLYSCSKNGCDKAYSKIGHLQRHIASVHNPQTNVTIGYLCPKEGCERVCKTLQGVKKHYTRFHTTHSNNASYKCEECNQSFSKIILWKKHMKTHKTFECQTLGCNQVFSQFTLLQKHTKLAHKKSFSCEFCDKTFYNKWNLMEHQETHLSRDERKSFCCPYSNCTRCYTRKYYLYQHIKSRHQNIKFLCSFPECGRRLVTKQKLQEHMKIHDSSRPISIRKQIARRQRKDAGIPKRSMAAKLSGVKISYAEEKNILLSQRIKTVDKTSDSSDE